MCFRGAYCTLGQKFTQPTVHASSCIVHVYILYSTVLYCILVYSQFQSNVIRFFNQTSYPYFLLCYAAGQTFEETKQLIIFRLETNPSSATKHFSSFLLAQLPVTLCNKLSYWWIAAPTSFPIGLTAMPHILVTPPPIGLQQLIAISQGTNSLIGGQQHQQAFLLV